MTTVKFWLMPNAGFESKGMIEKELKAFHEQNPKIDVEYEILSWSHAWFRLVEAVKEKSGPDVIQIGTTWIGTLGYLGAVQRLDGRKINTRQFLPAMFSLCQCFGHLWAVPWFCEGRVLYYRKDVLKKAGIEPAALDTIAGFTEACDKIRAMRIGKRRIAPLGFSFQKEQAIIQDLAFAIWGQGGDILSNDGKHATLVRPEALEGITFFLDLIAAGSIAPASIAQNTGAITEDFFVRDAYAFLFSSSWPLQSYLNPSFKHFIGREKAEQFGILPMPRGRAGRHNFAGGSALALMSAGRNTEKAWKLIDFLTSPASSARYCGAINMVPGISAAAVPLGGSTERAAIFADAITRYGKSFPPHPFWGSIEQIIINGITQTLREFVDSNCNRDLFFANLSAINQEIEYMLSVFGE